MRQTVFLSLIMVGLVAAAPACGGVSFQPAPSQDASVASGAAADASGGGGSGTSSGTGASGTSSGTGASGASSGTG
ncbi:MAG: hypothetical protein M3O50_20205, partial [Myxococcota bacterium]|nr:hypothetical protein [Myxococcota bacterium]